MRDKCFLPVVRWQQRKQSQRRQLPPLRLSDVVHAVDPHLYHTAQQLVRLNITENELFILCMHIHFILLLIFLSRHFFCTQFVWSFNCFVSFCFFVNLFMNFKQMYFLHFLLSLIFLCTLVLCVSRPEKNPNFLPVLFFINENAHFFTFIETDVSICTVQ